MELKIMVDDDRSSRRLQSALKQLGCPDLILSAQPVHEPTKNLSMLVMNQGAGVFHATSQQEMEQRLRAAGMKANLHSSAANNLRSSYLRRFIVRIFHLRAVEIIPCGLAERAFNLSGDRREQGEQAGLTTLERRLERLAVRALYTLGLDFGEVEISAGEGGAMVIQLVHAVPGLADDSSALKFAKAIAEESARLTRQGQEPLKLGMDPEFLLYNRTERKIVPASRFLEKTGIAGCDAVRSGDRTLYPIAELRPAPGTGPADLLRNLMGAMRYASRHITDTSLLWLAGGLPLPGLPLGGHLHFSGLPLTAELLRTLDNYLALPAALMEDERAKDRRPRYGYLGDHRTQGHGGFEYRTLPSFLVSPLLTKGVVALAALIAEEYRGLRSRPLMRGDVHQAFYLGNKTVLREAYGSIEEEIRAAKSYPGLEKYIEPFLKALRLGRTWDESRDIRTVWKIERPS